MFLFELFLFKQHLIEIVHFLFEFIRGPVDGLLRGLVLRGLRRKRVFD